MKTRKKTAMVEDDFEYYEDDQGLLYTCLGFLLALLLCAFIFWTCDYFGMFEEIDKPVGSQVEPVPVLTPELDGGESGEYESLIEQHPSRSYTSDYITI